MNNIIQNQVNETTDGIFSALGCRANDEQWKKMAGVVEDAVIKVTIDTLNQSGGNRYRGSHKQQSVGTEGYSDNSALIAILSSMR
ncbi:MAG: hypothetical protein H8D75_02520 [Rhodospirillaceae bacterium]|nr:hypothetical protein [Rhodospirillaceae bacterium]MBL6932198.1 hypothetical protein [Rhodospirillales bacterium]